MRRLAALGAGLSLLLVSLLLGLGLSSASAFFLDPSWGRWPSPTTIINYGLLSSRAPLFAAFPSAAGDWNAQTSFFFDTRAESVSACDPSRNGVRLHDEDCDGFDLGSDTLALTECFIDGNGIFDTCGITFRASESWQVYGTTWNPSFPDFYRVALHELGHVLGLGHEDTPGVATVMRSFVGSYATLQTDDLLGAAALYGLNTAVIQSLTLAPVGPYDVGTEITATAVVGNGVPPYQYRWWLYDGVTWTPQSAGWVTDASFSWTPTVADPELQVGVWVRGAGSTDFEATAALPVAFNLASLDSLVLSPPGVHEVGQSITATATASGGDPPYEYRWWLYDGATWTPQSAGWVTDASFSWTPTVANPDAQVGVWIRSASSGSDEPQDSLFIPAPVVPPQPATVDSLTLDPGPYTVGNSITATAATSGGDPPYEYRWWLYDGVDWSEVGGGWSTGNTYTWTPSVANPDGLLGVWVRSSGGSDFEDTELVAVPVTAPPPATIDALTLSPGPYQIGSSITATAATSGGDPPYEYRWWLYDGVDWSEVGGGWSAGNTYTWTPSVANPDGLLGVWVRSSGGSDFEDTELVAVPVTPPQPASISALTLSPGPYQVGSTITATATAAGGDPPYEYRWWLYDGVSWSEPSPGWTSTASLTWTPGLANANAQVGVWVRSVGSSEDLEGSAAALVAIAPPPPISIDSLDVSPAGVHIVGDTLTATAVLSGGLAPYEYRWWLYDGASWAPQGGWGASNSFSWTPAAANLAQQLGVWVRSAGSSADYEQTSALPVPVVDEFIAADLFPLDAGRTWTELSDAVTTTTEVQAGTVLINGVPTVVLEALDGPFAGSLEYVTNDASGLRAHAALIHDASETVPDLSITFSPPALELPAVFYTGDVITSSGSAVLVDAVLGTALVDYGSSSTVVGIETVSVPAGSFDATRIDFVLTLTQLVNGSTVSNTSVQTLWYAPGVGLVRSLVDGVLTELVGYTAPP